jgi:hypothetical protein
MLATWSTQLILHSIIKFADEYKIMSS